MGKKTNKKKSKRKLIEELIALREGSVVFPLKRPFKDLIIMAPPRYPLRLPPYSDEFRKRIINS
jgi:hypothetical protein